MLDGLLAGAAGSLLAACLRAELLNYHALLGEIHPALPTACNAGQTQAERCGPRDLVRKTQQHIVCL